MQFMKMTWMIMWRVGLFTMIFGPQMTFWNVVLLSALVAAILRYVMKVSINTFPIIRLIGKRPVVSRYGKHSTSSPASKPAPVSPSKKIIEKASKNGRTTGFEPYKLDAVPMPTSVHMRGVPGVGLSSAQHMTNYSVKSGQMGETNFAKALAVSALDGTIDYTNNSAGLLDRVNSFWSIAMPSEISPFKADKVFNTDIDAVIVSGNNILLIDTKFYTSGDVTYTSNGNQLYCIDNTTGSMVKKPREMTRNMSMALDRFRKHYPSMNVSAYVVMMPTNSGSASISNVFWPGNIPAVTIEQILAVIKNMASTSGTKVNDHATLHNLTSLQKG